MLKTLGSAIAFMVMLLTAAPALAQAVHVTVIVGLAGDPEHAKLFDRWAATLVDAATGRMAIPKAQIQYLTEHPEADPQRATGKSTREDVDKAFAALAATAKPEDVVFVVLIGHGTFDGRVAKFNLPGPDMTPADFAPLLQRLPSRHVVFVNTSSASGPFLEALSGPGRTIVDGDPERRRALRDAVRRLLRRRAGRRRRRRRQEPPRLGARGVRRR